MPKRVLDFDAMWGSDKLASCADWAQAEYAWLYGLADASGCFEITNLRVIWGRVAAIRGNLTIERLEQIFAEFQDRGLLFVWEHEGKRYAHWTGSDVPGRLPPPSWRMRLERFAPPVPKQKLAEYMARFARGRAALAGVGFRGEQEYAWQPPGNLKNEISDPVKNRRAGESPEDLRRAPGRRGKVSAAPDSAASGGRCFNGRVEETQGQDLDLGLNLDGNGEGKDGSSRGGCGDGRDRDAFSSTPSSIQLEANSNSCPQGAFDFNRRESQGLNGAVNPVARCGANSEAGLRESDSRPSENLPPKLWNELDTRGMSAKEIAVARELRVGQGPVCWPKGVRQEVIERDRLRELARAKAL
jgi:hypothetical protein